MPQKSPKKKPLLIVTLMLSCTKCHDQELVKTTLLLQLGAFLIIFPEMWWIENKVICKPEWTITASLFDQISKRDIKVVR